MPKAAIDEDGDFASGERDIGYAAWVLQNLVADSISQANAIYLPTQCQLWACPRLPHFCHTETGIR